MKIVSLNTGLPRAAVWLGRTVTTGIYWTPVFHRYRAGRGDAASLAAVSHPIGVPATSYR